jgi:glutaredoxin
VSTVILYSKPGCHLCDQAAAILDRLAQEIDLSWRRQDIRSDPDLWERFRYTIPVIEIDGGVQLAWPTTPERIRCALQDAPRVPR